MSTVLSFNVFRTTHPIAQRPSRYTNVCARGNSTSAVYARWSARHNRIATRSITAAVPRADVVALLVPAVDERQVYTPLS